ncbi:hypothetical protein Tco_0986872 [Tanacetum coccineum]
MVCPEVAEMVVWVEGNDDCGVDQRGHAGDWRYETFSSLQVVVAAGTMAVVVLVFAGGVATGEMLAW